MICSRWFVVVSIHAPTGGATVWAQPSDERAQVSIHAPTGGRDLAHDLLPVVCRCFNPRAHGGARRITARHSGAHSMFQSTRPRGGATLEQHVGAELGGVSIHAPTGGRDTRATPSTSSPARFQSTRPRGGATWLSLRQSMISARFQSTRPRGGATPSSQLHEDNKENTRSLRTAGKWLRRRGVTAAR